MAHALFEKLVLVTRKTALEELIQRFNTESQARFYIESQGASFAEYQDAHRIFQESLEVLKANLPDIRVQAIDRQYLPNFLFGPRDLVVTLGPDGLVVNTAKYLDRQPLVAVNPDPSRIDGILVPYQAREAGAVLKQVLAGENALHKLTMAQATLNNGQRLLAVNDLFIGLKSHASARYRICFGDKEESQSSSGIIVSTGAGSTGWFRSVLTGSAAVIEHFEQVEELEKARAEYRFDYQSDLLRFCVREPFISRASGAEVVVGEITPEEPLRITSQMPAGGVIFSDGVEQDFLAFDSGTTATIAVAERKLHLVSRD